MLIIDWGLQAWPSIEDKGQGDETGREQKEMSVIQANVNVESKKIILHLQYGGAKLHSVYSLPIFSRDRNHLDERLLVS